MDKASSLNKAGYTAIQSRIVGQEQYCENRSEFRNVTDGPTDTVRCRVAWPRLTTKELSILVGTKGVFARQAYLAWHSSIQAHGISRGLLFSIIRPRSRPTVDK